MTGPAEEPQRTDPPIDANYVRQTLFSVAGFLRLVQQGFAPSPTEAKELEDRIGNILSLVDDPPVPTEVRDAPEDTPVDVPVDVPDQQ